MENEKLLEIRNSLSMLPVLENRLSKLNHQIYEAEQKVKGLTEKFKEESFDVDKMKQDSLSTTLLKFVGKYEGKLTKETQEMLAAKLELDRAVQRVKELQIEHAELTIRISSLKTDKKAFEDELKKREELIMSNLTEEVSIKYRQLEAEQESLERLFIETDEAQKAAERANSTADNAMQHLESAESWATYDVWVKGGIFSHMAKYDHIDNAQAEFNRLSSQLNDLQKELSDIELLHTLDIAEIDTTTRVIDFWFDNIFTDLNVRDKIREDMNSLNSLRNRIDEIISKLEASKSKVKSKINEIEENKVDLIVSLETDTLG